MCSSHRTYPSHLHPSLPPHPLPRRSVYHHFILPFISTTTFIYHQSSIRCCKFSHPGHPSHPSHAHISPLHLHIARLSGSFLADASPRWHLSRLPFACLSTADTASLGPFPPVSPCYGSSPHTRRHDRHPILRIGARSSMWQDPWSLAARRCPYEFISCPSLRPNSPVPRCRSHDSQSSRGRSRQVASPRLVYILCYPVHKIEPQIHIHAMYLYAVTHTRRTRTVLSSTSESTLVPGPSYIS